jgi:hypothetical protein
MKSLKKNSGTPQSARFIEAAKKSGADETGKTFEKAFKKIAPPVRSKKPK